MRGIAARVALVVFGVLVALATLEGGLRSQYHLLPPAIEKEHRFWQYDPLLGWSKIPGAEGPFVGYEYHTHVKINSKGLRDDEVSYQKPPEEYRVLALGDSFTVELEVEKEQVWTEILEELLSTEGAAQVINAGTRGYGSDQEYLFLREEGLKYSPDLVLVAFFVNDVLSNRLDHQEGRKYAKPCFVLRDGQLHLTNVPPPQPPANPLKSLGRLLERSYIYRSAREVLETSSPGELPAYCQVYQTDHMPEWEEAWKVTEAILVEMQRLAESADAQLFVCYLPEQNQVSDSQWNQMALRSGEASSYDRERPNYLLGELCARHGIPYLDLTPAFRQHIAAGGPYPYFPVNAHLNAEGNRLAAQLIYEYLVEQGLFPGN
ncbi:MAG: SGNH/GDSL hydrolase family protein [Anaerolineae bacterium]